MLNSPSHTPGSLSSATAQHLSVHYGRRALAPPTPDIAESILSAHFPTSTVMQKRGLPIALIQECVARAYGMTREDLLDARRDQRRATPRQIAMYLCCALTDYSLPQLAREFGKKDHTTIMYARDQITKRIHDGKLDGAAVMELRTKIQTVHQLMLRRFETAVA